MVTFLHAQSNLPPVSIEVPLTFLSIFFTDPRIGAIGLKNVLEGRGWLWAKTKEAMKYIWKHHGNDADWFLKADDDTYVIMENLRALLKDKNASEPLYYGARFDSPRQKESYMSGGAGTGLHYWK